MCFGLVGLLLTVSPSAQALPKAPTGCQAVSPPTSVAFCAFKTNQSGYLEVDAVASGWVVLVNGSACTEGNTGVQADIVCLSPAGASVFVAVQTGIISVRESPVVIAI